MLFFFQAEDGIRDHCVTGVQTCALPISTYTRIDPSHPAALSPIVIGRVLRGQLRFKGVVISDDLGATVAVKDIPRSEERRVGKECRSRWTRTHVKKKKVKQSKET